MISPLPSVMNRIIRYMEDNLRGVDLYDTHIIKCINLHIWTWTMYKFALFENKCINVHICI